MHDKKQISKNPTLFLESPQHSDYHLHCIAGDPIAHSLSPAIYNRLYAYYEMPVLCVKSHVKNHELELFLQARSLYNAQAFNFTLPHKTAVIPFLDALDPLAEKHQSVNTVCEKDGKLTGYTTDALGYVLSLKEHGVSLANQDVLLLGAGGAANTIAVQTMLEGAKSLTIAARRLSAAQNLANHVQSVTGQDCQYCLIKDIDQYTPETSLLIQTTLLGMKGSADFDDMSFIDLLPASAVVTDIVYTPAITKLLAYAEKRGLQTVPGIGMLIWQAFAAFEIFYGQLPGQYEKELVSHALKASGFPVR